MSSQEHGENKRVTYFESVPLLCGNTFEAPPPNLFLPTVLTLKNNITVIVDRFRPKIVDFEGKEVTKILLPEQESVPRKQRMWSLIVAIPGDRILYLCASAYDIADLERTLPSMLAMW
jgi:hypothetical protein